MIKYRWVFIDEHSDGSREFQVAGDGGDGEGFRVVGENNVLERDELFEIFLFLHGVIEVMVTNPFDSGVDKGSQVLLEGVTPENGGRAGGLTHGNFKICC